MKEIRPGELHSKNLQATSQVAEDHESPPVSDEPAYNKMNAKNVSSKGALPSARTKHTAARLDPWPPAAVATRSGSKQPLDSIRGKNPIAMQLN